MSKFEKVNIWAEHHNGYHTKTYKEKTQYIGTYYIVLDLHTFVEKKPFLV